MRMNKVNKLIPWQQYQTSSFWLDLQESLRKMWWRLCQLPPLSPWSIDSHVIEFLHIDVIVLHVLLGRIYTFFLGCVLQTKAGTSILKIAWIVDLHGKKSFSNPWQGAVAAQSNHVCFAVAGRKTSSVCLTTNSLNLNSWIIFLSSPKISVDMIVHGWHMIKSESHAMNIITYTTGIRFKQKKQNQYPPQKNNKISSLYTIQIYTMQPSATRAALLDKRCSRFLDPAMCPPQSTSLMCLDVDKAWVQLWWLYR